VGGIYLSVSEGMVFMIEKMDDRNVTTFGQIAREMGRQIDDDMGLGIFLENIYIRLQTECMRDMREQKNKEQSNAV
jgi:Cu/Ag efflux pump CusA